MRVTFIVPSYARDPIGGIRVVYNFANQLTAFGHSVTVVHVARYRRRPRVRDGRVRQQAEQLLGGFRDLRRGPPAQVSWQTIDPSVELRYVPVLDGEHVPRGDVVVATAWQTADGVAGLDREHGRGYYLIQHHETWSGSERRVDETWRLPLHRVFIAPWLYQRALDMGLAASKVGGAIDVERFSVRCPMAVRPRRVAMLCSELTWKGAAEGAAALVEARRRHPDLEAVFFGAGPRPHDVPDWVEYVQNPTPGVLIDEIYNRSSIYLCPSHAEGWHLPPAEAMGCGCAVVSTDIDGVREYADDGLTALLSPARDPEALAANLCRLLDDDALRLRLAQAGHAEIQQFTWESATRDLERVFAGIPTVTSP